MPFNTALSGIRAANSDLQVTGNNVANASTTGFKSSRAEFGDVYASSLLGGGSNIIGSGVQLQDVAQQFDQGNLKFTQNELDVAISGGGFFIVDQGGDQLYTRSGAFGLDRDGNIVTNSGGVLQGFPADEEGNVGGVLGSLSIIADTQPPRQTTEVFSEVNVNANALVLQSEGQSFDSDGSAISVAQSGILTPTTTSKSVPDMSFPVDFSTNPMSFDIELTDSAPASGNGTVNVTLDSSIANSPQDVANLINSAIFGSASPINVQAVVSEDGENIELQDLNEGVASNISVSNVTMIGSGQVELSALSFPMDLGTDSLTFDLSLNGSAAGNGSTNVNLNAGVFNDPDDATNLTNLAASINVAIGGAVNVEAVVNTAGNSIVFRDTDTSQESFVNVTNVTDTGAGTSDLSDQLAAIEGPYQGIGGNDFATQLAALDVPPFATPIAFNATGMDFDLILANSGTNGTVNIALDNTVGPANDGVINDWADLATEINDQIAAAGTVITAQAVVNDAGDGIVFRDTNSTIASSIQVANISGQDTYEFAASLAAINAEGIPAVDNGYAVQTLEILNPDDFTISYSSQEGASAAQTASELNALAGVSATATTQATLVGNDGGGNVTALAGNLSLNGVSLTSTTLSTLEDEINALTTSTLPGISATYDDATDELSIQSAVGDDLRFNFSGAAAATLLVQGRDGTTPQTLNNSTDPDNGLVVGGSIDLVLDEGYSVTSTSPSVGNLFAPFTSDTFETVVINGFDPNDEGTYNHATSVTINDSLGNEHIMTQYFVKQEYDPTDPTTSQNQWVMYVQIDGQDVGDPDPTLPSPENTLPTQASFNLNFRSDGSLDTNLTDDILISNWTPLDEEGNPNGALDSLNALQGGAIPVVEPATSSNFEISLDGSTQYGSNFAVNQVDQNGYSTGRISGLDIDDEGIIFARFTNGETQTLGQIALADFNNQQGLQPTGNTMWAETSATGEPTIGAPGSASLGDITSGALEESNVDLSAELVNLIIAQRNFQASAKTIETANQTTQTIINLR